MHIDELPAEVRTRIRVDESAGRRQIDIRWKIHWPALLLCFGIPSALLYWSCLQENVGASMAGSMLFSLPLVWLGLSNVLNSTTIIRDGQKLTVRHHPLFRMGSDTECVRRVKIVEQERHTAEGHAMLSFRLYAQTTEGQMKYLRLHQLEEPVMRWLEQELNRAV